MEKIPPQQEGKIKKKLGIRQKLCYIHEHDRFDFFSELILFFERKKTG